MENKELPKKHGDFVKLILLNAQKRWPDSRWFQRDVGVFKTFRDTLITIGKKGQADLYGFIPYGENHVLWCELEVKLPKDKMSKHQISWKTTVENMRGMHVEVRSYDDLDQIELELAKRSRLL